MNKCHESILPKNLRPAAPEDITKGTVVWFEEGEDDPEEMIIAISEVSLGLAGGQFWGQGRKGNKLYLIYNAFVERDRRRAENQAKSLGF